MACFGCLGNAGGLVDRVVGGASVSLETKGMVAAADSNGTVGAKESSGLVAGEESNAMVAANESNGMVESSPIAESNGIVESSGMVEPSGMVESNGIVGPDSTATAVNSAVPEPDAGAPARPVYPSSSDLGGNCLPHSGQKLARTRMDTPQEGQRRAIGGWGIIGVSNWGFRIAAFVFRFRALPILHYPFLDTLVRISDFGFRIAKFTCPLENSKSEILRSDAWH